MASKKKNKTIVTVDIPVIGKDNVNRKRLLKLLGTNITKVTNYLENQVTNYAKTYHKGETISQVCIVNIKVFSKKGQKEIILTGYAVTERGEEIQLQTEHIQKKKNIANSVIN